MKTLRLLFVMVLVASAVVSADAQPYGGKAHARHKSQSGDEAMVFLMLMEPSDTLFTEIDIYQNRQQSASDRVREGFASTLRRGFRQAPNPQLIFSTRNGRFALGFGGFINLRTSYDFKGAVGSIDFVPYDIAMHNSYASRQQVMMDATTSRIFTKAVVHSSLLGPVVAYVDMDFRGGGKWSYQPRLRSAYLSVKGFTFGRDVTTFCDLMSSPTTVDFEGPNAYTFEFATLLRYEGEFMDKHFKYGVAAEMPEVSGTYGEHFAPIEQRVPDFPMYLQYAWGESRDSHFRLSAVLRTLYLHDKAKAENTTLLGWGVQASGRVKCCDFFTLYYNGIYGKGITRYIQDLAGSGLDFTPNPTNAYAIQTMPMWGVQASGEISLIPNMLTASGGYSVVKIQHHNGFYSSQQYKRGTYVFGNIFYNVTRNMRLAAEYLHGSRKDMSGEKATANRISIMAQYNF